ncbi:MAG: hypothetical protein P1U44_06765 [Vicingaceae bacterium]|jgi:hypothetical protein|nr:hypothetical protein [Vicingaceae bacterium]
MTKKVLIIFLTILLSFSCQVKYIKADKNMIYHIASVNNNVCKKLKGDVILYAIFVDSKYTGIWTQYDMSSTIDSIKLATKWIEKEAMKNGINLSIKIDYHRNKKIIPIATNFQRRTLSGTLFGSNGIKNVDRWADKVAKEALKPYGPDTSSTTKTKIVPKDRENLLARLRDIHQTDNVGLIYFINNFYTDEVSVVLHASEDYSPEYGIVSFKSPGTIAHEFLHLFGAFDLYLSPFDKKKDIKKKKEFAMKEFPNEIMAFPHRRLSTLEISPFTKYLIGWDNQLDSKYKDMLIGKKIKIVKY